MNFPFTFQPFTCYIVWDHKLSVYDTLLLIFSLMIFYLVSLTYATYGDDKSLYCFFGTLVYFNTYIIHNSPWTNLETYKSIILSESWGVLKIKAPMWIVSCPWHGLFVAAIGWNNPTEISSMNWHVIDRLFVSCVSVPCHHWLSKQTRPQNEPCKMVYGIVVFVSPL